MERITITIDADLVYEPCATVRDTSPDEFVGRQFTALKTFGGRFAYVTDGRNQGANRALAAAADRGGVLAITTELGGAAAADSRGTAMADRGVARVLRQLGILSTDTEAIRHMQVEGMASYVLASESGLFESCLELGQAVTTRTLVGQISFSDTPWRAPVPVIAEATARLQILAPYAGRRLPR